MTLVGLAACGDKVNPVTLPPVVADSAVTAVTVVPNNVTLAIGGTASLGASVSATPNISDRTVTWSTNNAAVATVSATGVVTAVGAGTTSIVATSKADPRVTGLAAVTVTPSIPVTVTISAINQGVNTAGLPVGVPASLTNVQGQLDITLNVEGNPRSVSVILKCGTDSLVQTQTLANLIPAGEGVELATAPVTLSINTTQLSATGQPLLRNNAACTLRAVATTAQGTQSASGTTTLTVNNADVANVTVTNAASATDPANRLWFGGGPVSVSVAPIMYSGRTPVAANIGLGLNNPIGGSNAPNPATQNIVTATAGAFVATWSNGPTAPSVQYVAGQNAFVTVGLLDNTGATVNTVNTVTVRGGTATITPANGLFNLDVWKPVAGTFPITTNGDQNIFNNPNGYVGANFRFVADSASGYRGPNAVAGNQTQNTDNGGVDRVTVIFQSGTSTTGTFTTVTNTTTLTETVAGTTNLLRQITTDALGNADTSWVASGGGTTSGVVTQPCGGPAQFSTAPGNCTRFGVDKTGPVQTLVSGPTQGSASTTLGATNGNYVFTITDNLSGQGTALVARVRNWNGLSTVSSANEGRINTNIITPPPGATYFAVGSSASGNNPCTVGRFNATAAASGAGAIAAFNAAGTAIGFCTPVPFTLFANSTVTSDSTGAVIADGYMTTTVIGTDVAGNQAVAAVGPPVTGPLVARTVLIDQVAPVINNIDAPATATGNTSVAFPANVTDNTASGVGDIVASWIVETLGTPAAISSLRFPATTGPGVAFDNVLTNATTVTPTIPNFPKNIQLVGPATSTAAPVAAGNAASVTVSAQGAGSNGVTNVGPLLYTFAAGAPQLLAGSTTTWSGTAGAATNATGWAVTSANATLSNCPAACTAVNPTSTVITATIRGPSGTFANPLSTGTVGIWYRLTAGGTTWFFLGNAATGVSRDDLTNRFWDFTFNFTPPKATPDLAPLTGGVSIDIIAIGINAAGDAIQTSTPVTIAFTNP